MRKYFVRTQNFVSVLIMVFLINTFGPIPMAKAEDVRLPVPGAMVPLSQPFDPPILKGIKINPDDPFRFDFILDVGDGSKPSLNGQVMNLPLQQESAKLVKYFLAGLTIPEKDLWVNLSPYEKDRIIPQSFGATEMGRDLLAEDYMLKQITASLIYPEDAIGKKFWERIYTAAAKKFGTTNIPVNTFNKVWIVPEKAVVYENPQAGTAYVVQAKLKVMLEQDYLALGRNVVGVGSKPTQERAGYEPAPTDVNQLGSQIVREIVIPQLTKEVNTARNFAQLRQVYNSLILATWYKKKIKDSILAQVYNDKNKIKGLSVRTQNVDERTQNFVSVQDIYQRYLLAFKKGAFNYIKEEIDPLTEQPVPRKYFSGGFSAFNMDRAMFSTEDIKTVPAGASSREDIVQVNMRPVLGPPNRTISTKEERVLDDPRCQFNERDKAFLRKILSLRIIGNDGKTYYLTFDNKMTIASHELAYTTPHQREAFSIVSQNNSGALLQVGHLDISPLDYHAAYDDQISGQASFDWWNIFLDPSAQYHAQKQGIYTAIWQSLSSEISRVRLKTVQNDQTLEFMAQKAFNALTSQETERFEKEYEFGGIHLDIRPFFQELQGLPERMFPGKQYNMNRAFALLVYYQKIYQRASQTRSMPSLQSLASGTLLVKAAESNGFKVNSVRLRGSNYMNYSMDIDLAKDAAMIAFASQDETEKVLRSIEQATENGQAEYLTRFVKSVQLSSPQEDPRFIPQWRNEVKERMRIKSENIIRGKLVKIQGSDGKPVYWILRNIKGDKKKSPDSPKYERLVYLLSREGGANFTQARELSQEQWRTLNLAGKKSDYYLVEAVEKENWHDELPVQDWSSSFCSLLVAGLFFSKLDTDIWNTSFIENRPVGIDSDVILKKDYSEKDFFLFLMLNNIVMTAWALKSEDPVAAVYFHSLIQTVDNGYENLMLVLSAVHRYGLGHGIVGAEGLNKRAIAQAINRMKNITNIEQVVDQLGFSWSTAEFVINKLKYNQAHLGYLADSYWQFLTETDGGFSQLDASDSSPRFRDQAMKTGRTDTGGIDLTAVPMSAGHEGMIKFKLDPVLLQQLQSASGFVPVIVNILPMTDLRQFLVSV